MTLASVPNVPIRLHDRKKQLASHLALDDDTELNAALEDLHILLDRCGYHIEAAKCDRDAWLRRRRSGRSSGAPGGRPKGSANWATRQLGLGLATIWYEQRGRAPTRRFDGMGEQGEYGPFHEFVACVIGAIPAEVKATRKGHVPQIDHLVRTAIEEFKAAWASPDEARRRGLLEEARWIR